MDELSLLIRGTNDLDKYNQIMFNCILPWTLRQATQHYASKQPRLYSYCRHILLFLLEINDDGQTLINEIETRKRWNGNSLYIIVELSSPNKSRECHTLLIENADDNSTDKEPWKRYHKIFDDNYIAPNVKRHYVLLEVIKGTVTNNVSTDNIRILELHQLLPTGQLEKTESEIFNEFWLKGR